MISKVKDANEVQSPTLALIKPDAYKKRNEIKKTIEKMFDIKSWKEAVFQNPCGRNFIRT